ncbi:hypothetical protein [Shimia isoporae]|nr:hypothetical protein [Shimia isoporae]
MSNDDPTLYDKGDVPQYGADIKEPGEPFGEETLDAIRNLVADDEAVAGVPQEALAVEPKPVEARPEPIEHNVAPVGARARAEATSAEWHDWVEAPRERSWRKLEIVEGGPTRALRRFLTTPRILSVALLSSVVYWQPMFIPMLVLTFLSGLLLLGALIGQDRMARIVGRRIQRFIWNDPARARFVEKLLPNSMRHLLYRPVTDDDAWDGPIDPSFAARISRIGG